MPRLVSWPMYAVDGVAVAAFWNRLREAMLSAGIADVPVDLAQPDDLPTHWRDPTLLLSQTCGYPFTTALAGAVRYVATPRFTAPGCDGAFYRSAVVVRADEIAQSLADMAGRRVAFNSDDSQSGYNGLRSLVAPLSVGGRFFGDAIETGAHRRSMAAVAVGEADVAAVDVVTFALLQAHLPETTAGLRILCHTQPAPGLPFITALGTSDHDLQRLREALAIACSARDPAARALLLDGVEQLPESEYQVIPTMGRDADGLGYTALL